MTYSEKIIGINPIVPVVAFTISLSALSGTPMNISLNSNDLGRQNIEYQNSRACLLPGNRKRNNETSIISQIEFSEADFTHSPIFVDLVTTPTIVSNAAVNEKITELSNISFDWDGYDGYAPTQQVINNTNQFLKSLPEKYLLGIDEDNIYPNPNGTISIKWVSDIGKVSIEIGNSTAAFFSYINNKYDKEEKMSTVYLSDKFISALNDLTRV